MVHYAAPCAAGVVGTPETPPWDAYSLADSRSQGSEPGIRSCWGLELTGCCIGWSGACEPADKRAVG